MQRVSADSLYLYACDQMGRRGREPSFELHFAINCVRTSVKLLLGNLAQSPAEPTGNRVLHLADFLQRPCKCTLGRFAAALAACTSCRAPNGPADLWNRHNTERSRWLFTHSPPELAARRPYFGHFGRRKACSRELVWAASGAERAGSSELLCRKLFEETRRCPAHVFEHLLPERHRSPPRLTPMQGHAATRSSTGSQAIRF